MQRIHITLRDRHADRLREEAIQDDRTISYLIQKLVERHYDMQPEES
jgi:hypothetical protein